MIQSNFYVQRIESLDPFSIGKLLHDNLYNIRDVELMILKGHIVIEYIFNITIEKLTKANRQKLTEYSFAIKHNICEGLGLFHELNKQGVVEEIKTINKLRTQIAHTLTYDKSELENLYKYHRSTLVSPTEIVDEAERTIKNLYLIFIEICGSLTGRLQLMIEINNELLNYPIEEKMIQLRNRIRSMNEELMKKY